MDKNNTKEDNYNYCSSDFAWNAVNGNFNNDEIEKIKKGNGIGYSLDSIKNNIKKEGFFRWFMQTPFMYIFTMLAGTNLFIGLLFTIVPVPLVFLFKYLSPFYSTLFHVPENSGWLNFLFLPAAIISILFLLGLINAFSSGYVGSEQWVKRNDEREKRKEDRRQKRREENIRAYEMEEEKQARKQADAEDPRWSIIIK